MIHSPRRTWRDKFADTFRGVRAALRGQTSFGVHLVAAVLVIAAAAVLQLSSTEWAVLLLSITVVLVAEILNTALECLARAITSERHPAIGQALDLAAAAVLLAALGAACVGAVVFGRQIWQLLQ